MAGDTKNSRVCVGAIAGAHGVRGAVRIKTFTEEPEAVAAYGPVESEDGARRFDLRLAGRWKSGVVATLDGVADRDGAEALRGLRLYVDRERLPPPDDADEFYHADLIGLRVERADGAVLGTVSAVNDHGAGALLDVTLTGGRVVVLPFTKAVVPTVDIAAGRLVADPPPGLFDEDS
jgi:16S rRNA processing protein RimM